MPDHPAAARALTAALAQARRSLRQQLDALSRLAAAAWRRVDPAPPESEPNPAVSLSARILNLTNALRLEARIAWAMRLITALRAKLLDDLRAVESGQLPRPAVEARCIDAEPEQPTAQATPAAADKLEPPERRERPERERRERFGFESLKSDDDLAEILKRPPAEIIALICRELGLPEDWPRLAEEAWARETAEADAAEPPWAPPSGAQFQPSPSSIWSPAAPS